MPVYTTQEVAPQVVPSLIVSVPPVVYLTRVETSTPCAITQTVMQTIPVAPVVQTMMVTQEVAPIVSTILQTIPGQVSVETQYSTLLPTLTQNLPAATTPTLPVDTPLATNVGTLAPLPTGYSTSTTQLPILSSASGMSVVLGLLIGLFL